MDESSILLKFLDLLKNAPANIVLIAFALWMGKHYLINGTVQALKEFAEKYLKVHADHEKTTQEVVSQLVAISKQHDIMIEAIKNINQEIRAGV